MLVERFAPDLGGLARSGARVAGALVRHGVDVDVLAWSRALPPGRVETVDAGDFDPAAKGVVLHRLGLFGKTDFSMQYTMNVLDWLHGERGFDAVWGHYVFWPGFCATMFATRNGLPSTVSARGNDIDRMSFPPGDFSRLVWTLDNASVITSVTHDLAGKIDALLGRDARVEVIGNVVDGEVFAPGAPDIGLRRGLGIADDEAVLGFSGELRQKKGFGFMVEALRTVRATRPACLLVIGEIRPRERSLLAEFAADHPRDAVRIVVTGRLEQAAEVARHLRVCDVLLSPSLWDGLPNAVLEALACGLVTIGSDAGGIPEVITHGVDGVILPRHRLGDLGDVVLETLAAPAADLQAIRAAARRTAVTRFHPDEERAALGRVLGRLANNAP